MRPHKGMGYPVGVLSCSRGHKKCVIWSLELLSCCSSSLGSANVEIVVKLDFFIHSNVALSALKHTFITYSETFLDLHMHFVVYDPISAHFFPCGYDQNLTMYYESVQFI